MREGDDKQLQEIEPCTETVKLDANKIKEHLAAENATTRVDGTKRSTQVEHKIRAEGVGGGGGGGETRNRDREVQPRRGGVRKSRRWKDATGLDASTNGTKDATVQRLPSEMAGKTGRTVRSRARPHANRADASVPSGKESWEHAGQTSAKQRRWQRDQRRAQERRERGKAGARTDKTG